ncbi:MAG: response regulator [Acidobacteriota bacterium]|nr:response regulator [Acidobacteriota bacterium]
MTPATKKAVRRYGIPIDLAILATGVGLLLAGTRPALLVILYLLAIAASFWKGGRPSALTAGVVSFVILFVAFRGVVHLAHGLVLVVFTLAICAIPRGRRAVVPVALNARPIRGLLAAPAVVIVEQPIPVTVASAELMVKQRPPRRQRTRRSDAPRDIRLAQRSEQRKRGRRKSDLVADLAAERAAREELQRRLVEDLEAVKRAADRKVMEARVELARKYDQQLKVAQAAGQKPPPAPAPAPARASVRLKPIKATPARPAPKPRPAPPKQRVPRILMLERRRAAAGKVLDEIKALGVEVEVVERWIDAIDEVFRFRPDAIFVDVELEEFEKVHQSISQNCPGLPIVLTVDKGELPKAARAASAARPYDPSAIVRIARQAMQDPANMIARQVRPIASPPPPEKPAPPLVVALPAEMPAELPAQTAASGDEPYSITCSKCAAPFDAMQAEWCSCLTKRRTLVCPNCLTCFCHAHPSYRESIWLQAPSRFLEVKAGEIRRQRSASVANPDAQHVKRPLVMLVEDDEDIHTIVRRVCERLGCGFVAATNGQDGLEMARTYHPNLILSDAFMPKLDGREMCRMLKEESAGTNCRMIIMTGLYTDAKYKSEALKRFHVDEYLVKPVAINELMQVLQKHLGAQEQPSAPPGVAKDDVPVPVEVVVEKPVEQYEVQCAACQTIFEATSADWCTCVGADHTLICPGCKSCFCKASPAYRQRFWGDAPPSLFERRMIGSNLHFPMGLNPQPVEVKRPLVLLVEDDENIQLIVKTVVTSLGYGFIVGGNGEEGLHLARKYDPDLILSDALMPKLDGREMCRILKQDPATARAKAIIMTGLYTERKYRTEALSRFHVDDYVAKPLAVSDLIQLLKKHLGHVAQPPPVEGLFAQSGS